MMDAATKECAARLRATLLIAPGTEKASAIEHHLSEAVAAYEKRIADLEFLVEQYCQMIDVAFGDGA